MLEQSGASKSLSWEWREGRGRGEGFEGRHGYFGHLIPAEDCFAACLEIAAFLPEALVMILIVCNQHSAFVVAVKAGTAGYLKKQLGKNT